MRYCAVKNCENNDLTKGISFFHFPKDAERLETWIKFVNCPNFQVKSSSFICSAHFSPHMLTAQNHLRPGSIPTPPEEQDDTTIVVLPTTEAGADLFSELFNLEEESSATDIYLDALQCNTEYRDAVLNYVAGFIMRKMKAQENCIDCALYLNNLNNIREGKLLNKKNRGGLTLPSKEFEKVVSITDSLYSEINNEKLFSQKNIITKLQCQTYKVICELHPEMFSQLENHVGAFGSHKSIVVKKIVGCYASLRAKHSCKLENQKNPKIRVQLSKLILFKNQ